jgi:hypothetical protein
MQTYDKRLQGHLDHEHNEYALRSHDHPEYDQSKEINEIRELAKQPVPYEHRHGEYVLKDELRPKLMAVSTLVQQSNELLLSRVYKELDKKATQKDLVRLRDAVDLELDRITQEFKRYSLEGHNHREIEDTALSMSDRIKEMETSILEKIKEIDTGVKKELKEQTSFNFGTFTSPVGGVLYQGGTF